MTKNKTEHKDLLGYDLKVGDHVVYPTGYSSEKHMCVAEIVKFMDFDEIRSYQGERKDNARGAILTRVVKHWKVRLQPKFYNDYRQDKEYNRDTREFTATTPRQVDVHRVENLVKVTLPDGE